MTKTKEEKKENKRSEEKSKRRSSKNKKRKEFFEILENKVLDFGEVLLKKGLASLAISQINNTEDKIKEELEKKFKKYQNKIFKTLSLAVALSFLFYGLIS